MCACMCVASPLPRCAHGGVVVCSSSDAVIDEKSYVKSMRGVAICALLLVRVAASGRRVQQLPQLSQATALLSDASVGGEVPPKSNPRLLAEYAVVSALDTAALPLLNQLFGTCFPLDNEGSADAVMGELCLPLARGTPAFLFLGAAAGEAPTGALALADVWIAVLPSDGDPQPLLERVADVLARLPPMPSDAPPRTLMVIGQDASQRLVAAELQSRLEELSGSAQKVHGVAVGSLLSVQVAHYPEDGPTLLGRFAHRDRPGHVLPDGLRAARAGVGLRDAPFLLELLLPILDTTTAVLPGDGAAEVPERADRARAGSPVLCAAASERDWCALIGCGRAKEAAIEAAGEHLDALRSTIEEMRLNPLAGGDFSARLDGIIAERPLELYDAQCRTWQGTAAHSSQRDHLREALAARAGELLEGQLGFLCEDALTTFRGELAVLLAASASYKRSAHRLISKVHAKAVREAKRSVPPSLRSGAHAPAATAMQMRACERLRKAMGEEVALHEDEAEDLPPREQDVAPPPWWKQLLAQAIGMVLNVAQAYLLQHLPAQRRDRADERAMPRAPLF